MPLRRRSFGAILSLAICLGFGLLRQQEPKRLGRQPVHFNVSGPVERLEMIVNTSRILTTEHKVPQLLVENQGVVRAQPISPNQVQLSALKAGFTTLTVWDENQGEHTIDVLVYGDARELENLLMTEFPEATLRVRPLAASVVISGYVPRAEMVSRIVLMAQDYYPSVINNITIGGVQQILLHVKLMEVSRTKLRQLGFDWANFNGDDAIVQSVAGLISSAELDGRQRSPVPASETIAFGIVNNANSFFGFIDALRQYNLVKVLAEPTLVTVSGRPASFSSGGEFPDHCATELGDQFDRVSPVRHASRLCADCSRQWTSAIGSAASGERNRPGAERHNQQHDRPRLANTVGRYRRRDEGRTDAWPWPV